MKILFARAALLIALCSNIALADKPAWSFEHDKIKSKVIHYSEAEFARYASECKGEYHDAAGIGKSFLEVIPENSIRAVEIAGDEVTLPSAIVLRYITDGKFISNKNLLAVQNAPTVRVRLQNNKCFLLHFLIDPAHSRVAYAESPISTVVVPKELQPEPLTSNVRVGMTRAGLEKAFCADGGISAPFRYERYVSIEKSVKPGEERIKVNLAFKPAGMSDAVYFLGKWQTPTIDKLDTIMRISPFYLERPYTD